MCGIAGIFSHQLTDQGFLRCLLERWHALLRHRGPDDWGWFRCPQSPIALFHARLAVTGVMNGRQPLSDETGRIWLTFNGEIYNHRELRRELEVAGHRFSSDSDGEVIIHLYESSGIGAVAGLRGEFAFALYDADRKKVFLVRDRFGIKPLYYAARPGYLHFGSEAKAIFADPGFPRRFDGQTLQNQLQTFSFADETLFEGIRQVPPSHAVGYDLVTGELEKYKYWELPLGRSPSRASYPELKEAFGRLFREAVRIRIPDEAPFGAFLSGGLDSSAIVRTMTDLHAPPFPVFSIGFDAGPYDELPYSSLLARQLGLPQHVVSIGRSDLQQSFLRSVWHSEIPVTNPHGAAKQMLALEARKHCKVVLTGEGADELLYGYGLFDHLRQHENAGATGADPGRWIGSGSLSGKLEHYGDVTRQFGAYPYPLKRHFYMRRISRFLLAGKIRKDHMLWDWKQELPPHFGPGSFDGLNSLQATQRFLLATDFPAYLLNYLGDRQELSAGLEGRVPFLDHHLAEFICSLPEDLKLRGHIGKFMLREMLRGRIDQRLADRPKQVFYAPALDSLGFRSDPLFFKRFIDRTAFEETGVFNPAFFRLLTQAAGWLPARSKLKPVLESVAVYVLSFQMVSDFFIRGFDHWQSHFAPVDAGLEVENKRVN